MNVRQYKMCKYINHNSDKELFLKKVELNATTNQIAETLKDKTI